jgi:hypothetical protein
VCSDPLSSSSYYRLHCFQDLLVHATTSDGALSVLAYQLSSASIIRNAFDSALVDPIPTC